MGSAGACLYGTIRSFTGLCHDMLYKEAVYCIT
jgi:hypothetical protein